MTGQGKEISERKERERERDKRETKEKKGEERKISVGGGGDVGTTMDLREGKTILRLRAKRGYNSPILIRDNTSLDFCTF